MMSTSPSLAFFGLGGGGGFDATPLNYIPRHVRRRAPLPDKSGSRCHPCGVCRLPIDVATKAFAIFDLCAQLLAVVSISILNWEIHNPSATTTLFWTNLPELMKIYKNVAFFSVIITSLEISGSVYLLTAAFKMIPRLLQIWSICHVLAILCRISLGIYALTVKTDIHPDLDKEREYREDLARTAIYGMALWVYRWYGVWIVACFWNWLKNGPDKYEPVPMTAFPSVSTVRTQSTVRVRFADDTSTLDE